MVLHDDLVIASIIVVSKIVALQRRTLNFLTIKAKEVHFCVALNLNLFVVCQLRTVECQRLSIAHRKGVYVANGRGRLLRI